jgi:hypothetical protein
VACVSLGKPYTNAAQERSFSLASWFNGLLMMSAKDETFEIRCIEAMNRTSVKQVTLSLAEHKSEFQVKELSNDHRVNALANFCAPEAAKTPTGRVATIFGGDGEVLGHLPPSADISDGDTVTEAEANDDDSCSSINLGDDDDQNVGWTIDDDESPGFNRDSPLENEETQRNFLNHVLGQYNEYLAENN